MREYTWTYDDHRREAAIRENTARQQREGTAFLQRLRQGRRMRRPNR